VRFLVDESAGPGLAASLRDQGHEVLSIYDDERGLQDDQVIQRAYEGNWVLITSDKDFGELVYRERRPHKGVVLLRLENQRREYRVQAVRRLLERYGDRVPGNFVVVTEQKVRFARPTPGTGKA
jgi:predicted nuclease of predicted toxin-antitoxin system